MRGTDGPPNPCSQPNGRPAGRIRLASNMSRQRTRGNRRWALKDWRGLAIVAMAIGTFIGGIGAVHFFGGMPEYVRMSRLGLQHVSEEPAGLPQYLILMIVGGVAAGIGAIVFAAVTVVRRRSGAKRSTLRR